MAESSVDSHPMMTSGCVSSISRLKRACLCGASKAIGRLSCRSVVGDAEAYGEQDIERSAAVRC